MLKVRINKEGVMFEIFNAFPYVWILLVFIGPIIYLSKYRDLEFRKSNFAFILNLFGYLLLISSIWLYLDTRVFVERSGETAAFFALGMILLLSIFLFFGNIFLGNIYHDPNNRTLFQKLRLPFIIICIIAFILSLFAGFIL